MSDSNLSELQRKTLQQFRDGIDEIDKQLIRLFDERAALVFKVGEWKKLNSFEVHDPNREKQILEKIARSPRHYLKDHEIQSLFMRMIEFYRNTEKIRTLINHAKNSAVLSEKSVFGFLGFGLIGASVALALRDAYPQAKFLIHDPLLETDKFEEWNRTHAHSAFQVVNRQQLDHTHVLFLAAPIDINQKQGEELAAKNQLTLNLGSYQTEIKNVVGFHPLAGKETSGYEVAQADLFHGKIICTTSATPLSPENQKTVECLAHSLGAELVTTSHQEHNEVLAYSSHLVQLLSLAFGNALAKQNFDKHTALIPNMAQQLLRLTGSDAKMWEPILIKNRAFISKALQDLQANLKDIQIILDEPSSENQSSAWQKLFQKSHKIYQSIYLKKGKTP